MTGQEKFRAYLAWILVCTIWGTTYLAIRVAVKTIPDALLSGARFTIAGGLMCLYFLIRREKFPPFSQWGTLLFIGISLIAVSNWLVVWAENFVPSGPTALLVATAPFWMATFETWYRPQAKAWNWKKLMGLVLGFGGVALLVLPELKEAWDKKYLLGVIGVQAASAAWAVGSLYSKYKKVNAKPLVNASMEMLMGGVVMLSISLLKGDPARVTFDAPGLYAFFYLVFIGAMVGFVAYIYALEKLPSSTVSLYAYINPVIAVWLGWAILDEKVTVMTILATAVILAGVWLVKGKGGQATESEQKQSRQTEEGVLAGEPLRTR